MQVQVTDQNFHGIVKRLVLDNRKVPKGSNLQNIPSRGDGFRVRNMFKPGDGWVFVSADLSQIEPRVMAHIMYDRYGDNSLRQIFIDGRDLYTTMAMLVFELPEEYCVDKAWFDPKTGKGGKGGEAPPTAYFPRRMMKTGVLARSYDQKVRSFARNMNVSIETAEMFYERFDNTFKHFSTMVQDIRAFMIENGYVETLFGRKRRFPRFKELERQFKRNEQKLIDLYNARSKIQRKLAKTETDLKKLAEIEAMIQPLAEMKGEMEYMLRAAFNAVIQGSAADIMKMNMIRLYEICDEKGWELNASIHDEAKTSMPKSDLTRENCELITEAMTQTVKLSLPLKSDTVVEARWMMEYGVDEWDFENGRPFKLKYTEFGETDALYAV